LKAGSGSAASVNRKTSLVRQISTSTSTGIASMLSSVNVFSLASMMPHQELRRICPGCDRDSAPPVKQAVRVENMQNQAIGN
jgi:hypothetical protein